MGLLLCSHWSRYVGAERAPGEPGRGPRVMGPYSTTWRTAPSCLSPRPDPDQTDRGRRPCRPPPANQEAPPAPPAGQPGPGGPFSPAQNGPSSPDSQASAARRPRRIRPMPRPRVLKPSPAPGGDTGCPGLNPAPQDHPAAQPGPVGPLRASTRPRSQPPQLNPAPQDQPLQLNPAPQDRLGPSNPGPAGPADSPQPGPAGASRQPAAEPRWTASRRPGRGPGRPRTLSQAAHRASDPQQEIGGLTSDVHSGGGHRPRPSFEWCTGRQPRVGQCPGRYRRSGR